MNIVEFLNYILRDLYNKIIIELLQFIYNTILINNFQFIIPTFINLSHI